MTHAANVALVFESICRQLARFRRRAVLVGLCIALSVFAIVLLPAVADAFIRAVDVFNQRMNPADTVVLYGNLGSEAGRPKNNLKLADIDAVRRSVPTIKDVDINVRGGVRTVKNGARSASVMLTGASDRAPWVQRIRADQGDYFDEAAVDGRAHVAVIGKTTAARLFGEASALGAEIVIDNVPFRVIGEQQRLGVGPHGNDLDDTLVVPYTTLMDHLLHVDTVTSAKFTLNSPENTAKAAEQMTELVRQRHKIDAGRPDDFAILTPDAIQQRVAQGRRVFTGFIVLTGACAFLVSIFVIANIVSVAMKERTPEIGIRKAVGWTRRIITIHMLSEVGIVALVAAAAGVLLAETACVALAPILAAKSGVTALAPTAVEVLTAIALAISAAVIAALVPVFRAVNADPVAALRSGT